MSNEHPKLKDWREAAANGGMSHEELKEAVAYLREVRQGAVSEAKTARQTEAIRKKIPNTKSKKAATDSIPETDSAEISPTDGAPF